MLMFKAKEEEEEEDEEEKGENESHRIFDIIVKSKAMLENTVRWAFVSHLYLVLCN
jgi:hypothetical protein